MDPDIVLIYPDINFPFLLLSQILLTGKSYGILVIIAVIACLLFSHKYFMSYSVSKTSTSGVYVGPDTCESNDLLLTLFLVINQQYISNK